MRSVLVIAALVFSSLATGCATSLAPMTREELATADDATLDLHLRRYSGHGLPSWDERAGWPSALRYRWEVKREALSRHSEWSEADRTRWMQEGPERGMPREAAEIVLGPRHRRMRDVTSYPAGTWERASYGPNVNNGAQVYHEILYRDDQIYWLSESNRPPD